MKTESTIPFKSNIIKGNGEIKENAKNMQIISSWNVVYKISNFALHFSDLVNMRMSCEHWVVTKSRKDLLLHGWNVGARVISLGRGIRGQL